MSTTVDQRTKGQSHASSNGPSKEQVNEDFDNYLQQQQLPQTMRQTWSGGYNTAATLPAQPSADQPQQQQQTAYMPYYPATPAPMSYPYVNQAGPTISDAAWSNGPADPTINFLGGYGQMGAADYMNSGNAMFGGYSGFQPSFGWEYSGGGDFNAWGAPAASGPGAIAPTGPSSVNSNSGRKDERLMSQQYHSTTAADGYYMPPPQGAEHHGAVGYGSGGMSAPGTINGSEMDNDLKVVESGLKDVNLSSGANMGLDPMGKGNAVSGGAVVTSKDPSMHSTQSQSMVAHHQHNNAAGTQGGSGPSSAGSSKKSWATIASAPAKSQLNLKPRSIPRAPVLPGVKNHSAASAVVSGLDIGTWDNSVKREVASTGMAPGSKSVSGQPLPTKQWNAAPTNSAIGRATGTVGQQRSSTASSTYNTSVIGSSVSSNAPGAQPNGQPPAESMPPNPPSVSSSVVGQSITSTSTPVTSAPLTPSDPQQQNHQQQPPPCMMNLNTSAPPPVMPSYSMPMTRTLNGMASSSSNGMDPSAKNPVLDRLRTANQYNPRDLSGINYKNARFFIIKSYSEDDIHRSIKYSIWCSTEHGNKRLDGAYKERENKGPIYLFFSVNGSGHFCGMTQMMSPVDYSASSGVWAQDKWKGQFEVKWIYVKDVPNSQLRHIKLENNENKPVTNSRDTQEVPPEKGRQVLKIINAFKHTTSIFDDFSHYEKRQEEDHQNPRHTERGHRERGHHNQGSERGHYGGGDRGGHYGNDRGHHGGSDRGHHAGPGGDRGHFGGDREGGRHDRRDHHGEGRRDRGRHNYHKEQHHQH